ncbi:MAG: hypothetical protein ACFFDN_16975 [Candidatus Hodarchaeota archaeon]
MNKLPQTQDTILIDDKQYIPMRFEDEKDLSDCVASLSDFVYGRDSIYFHWEKRVRPSSGRYNVTDGLLLDLSNKPFRFWIVEYELGSHSISSHIQPQIIGFMRALRNSRTLREVQLDIYNEIRADEGKLKRMKDKIGESDIFFGLDQILHREPGILVVVDERTSELEDVLDYLSLRSEEVRVLEFKRYSYNDEEIYRFNTLSLEEAEVEIETVPKKEKRPRPPHRLTWEARLEWVSPKVKELFEIAKQKILSQVPSAIHGPREKQRHYFFYTKEPQVHRNIFAVILIQKQMMRIRLRLPDDFEDPENLTKLYKGWFFSKGQERAIEVRNKTEINLLDEYLIKAYNYTKNLS